MYFCSPPLSLDGMLVHCRVIPSIKFASAQLYTWVEGVERGTVNIKCLAEELPETKTQISQSLNTDIQFCLMSY